MRIFLLIAIFWLGAACAQDDGLLTSTERQGLLERAQSQHDQADALRTTASAQLAAADKTCWDKFFVTSCMDNAKTAYHEAMVTVRNLEKESRQIRHELRKREFAAREASQAVEVPQRAAAAAQAEKNRQAQQAAQERVEQRRHEARP